MLLWIVNTTFERQPNNVYTYKKCSIFMQKNIRNPISRYIDQLQLEMQLKITKQASCNYGDHTFTLYMIHKKLDFLWIFVKRLLCAVNRQSCIPFDEHTSICETRFMIMLWISGDNHESSLVTFSWTRLTQALVNGKKGKEKKKWKSKRKKKQKTIHLIRHFYFSDHACTYKTKSDNGVW